MKIDNPDFLSDEEFLEKKEVFTNDKERALKVLQKVSKNQDNGIDEVLDMLNFFLHVRERFDKGDLKTKKEICQKLGSNLKLYNQKLYIDDEKSIFELKKGIESIAPEFGTFELGKSVYIKRKLPPVGEISSKWLLG